MASWQFTKHGESPPSQETVSDFLGNFHALMAAHFALEEKEMRAMGCDVLYDCKDDQQRPPDEIRNIMDDFMDEPPAE